MNASLERWSSADFQAGSESPAKASRPLIPAPATALAKGRGRAALLAPSESELAFTIATFCRI